MVTHHRLLYPLTTSYATKIHLPLPGGNQSPQKENVTNVACEAQHEGRSYYVSHFHLTLSFRSSASLRCTSLEAAEAAEAEAAEVVIQRAM